MQKMTDNVAVIPFVDPGLTTNVLTSGGSIRQWVENKLAGLEESSQIGFLAQLSEKAAELDDKTNKLALIIKEVYQ